MTLKEYMKMIDFPVFFLFSFQQLVVLCIYNNSTHCLKKKAQPKHPFRYLSAADLLGRLYINMYILLSSLLFLYLSLTYP